MLIGNVFIHLFKGSIALYKFILIYNRTAVLEPLDSAEIRWGWDPRDSGARVERGAKRRLDSSFRTKNK